MAGYRGPTLGAANDGVPDGMAAPGFRVDGVLPRQPGVVQLKGVLS
jgi:hypothetical protein